MAAEVAHQSAAQFGDDLEVALAVGRLYLAAVADLVAAQNVIIRAAQTAREDPRAFRLLGELLLRRGDAQRAVKAFERTMQLGLNDADTRAWRDRGERLLPLQKNIGTQAVADALARMLETEKAARRALSRAPQAPKPRPKTMLGLGPAPAPSAPRQAPPPPPPPAADAPEEDGVPTTVFDLGKVAPPPPPPWPPDDHDDDEDVPTQVVDVGEAFAYFRREASGAHPSVPAPAEGIGKAPAAAPTSPAPTPLEAPPAAGHAPQMPEQAQPVGAAAFAQAAVPTFPVAQPAAEIRPEQAAPALLEPEPIHAPHAAQQASAPAATESLQALEAADFVSSGGLLAPAPQISDALQLDPNGAMAMPPEPRKGKGMGLVVGIALALIAVGAGVGGYFVWHAYTTRKSEQAAATLRDTNHNVLTGTRAELTQARTTLEAALSTNPSGPLKIVQARLLAVRALEYDRSKASLAELQQVIDDPLLDQPSSSAARMALELARGNTSAALEHANTLMKGAKGDPFLQYLLGLSQEAMGQAERASEHYELALQAEPGMRLSRIRLARLRLLTARNADDRAETIKVIEALGQGDEATVLRSMVTCSAPSEEPRAAELPRSLQIVATIEASHDLNRAEARTVLQNAAASIEEPWVALYCADHGLDRGDVEAAKPCLDRVSQLGKGMTAQREVTAKAALIAGDLAAAQAQLDNLPAPKGSLLKAVLAYESLQPEALGNLTKSQLAAEEAAFVEVVQAVLQGRAVTEEQLEPIRDTLGGDLVAMDAALDAGNLEAARAITQGWGDEPHPLRSIRRARLLRYEGKLDQAAEELKKAGAGPRTTFERVLLQIETHEGRTEALKALEDASAAGPLGPWLKGYVLALESRYADARAACMQQPAPDADSAMPVRVAAALVFGAVQERKAGGELMRNLLERWGENPDVIRAAVYMRLLPSSALKKP